MSGHRVRPADLGLMGATAAAVVLLGVLAVHLAPQGSSVAAWWPAGGVSALYLAVAPRRLQVPWVGVVLVANALANALGGRDLLVALGFGAANAVEAVVVVALLRRWPGGPSLLDLRDFLRLGALALTCSAAAAAVAGPVAAAGLGADLTAVVRSVFASHAAAVVLLTPVGLRADRFPSQAGHLERVAQALLLAVGVAAGFAADGDLPLAFLALPALVWGAQRLSQRAVCWQLVVVGVLATVLTRRGLGPFAGASQDGASTELTAALLQCFLVVAVGVALPLAVTNAQRRRALGEALAAEEMRRRSFDASLVGQVSLLAEDGRLRVVEANAAARTLLGLPDQPDDPDHPDLLEQALGPAAASALHAGAAAVVGGRAASWTDDGPVATTGRTVRLALSAVHPEAFPGRLGLQAVDLTAERASARDAAREHELTQGILEAATALLVVVDADGVVSGLGVEAEAFVGPDAEGAVGRPVGHLAVADHHQALTRLVDDARRTGRRQQADVQWETAAGPRLVSTAAMAVHDPSPSTLVVLSGTDVTEERAARDLLERVLESATGTAIVATDATGTITLFNPGAERLLGHRAEDVVGRRTAIEFHDPAEIEARAAELGVPGSAAVFFDPDSPEVEPRDWTWVRADGERRRVSLTVAGMRSGEAATGSYTGFVGIAEDVTDRRRAEDALRRALDAERETMRRQRALRDLQSDFVSSVSHELRTPITSVLGYTAMLANPATGALSPHQEMLVDRVERNSRRLLSLIEDLLTLSAVESGRFRSARRPVDLVACAREAVEVVDGLLAGRSLQFDVDLPDGPVVVVGDEDQLARALINLVTNAVKFTPDGGRVAVRVREAAPDAVVEVADTGIGVASDEVDALFGRFFRATNARRGATGGSGLGLSIVATIVEAHRGTIDVDTALGAGSTFTLRLPLATGQAREARSATTVPSEPGSNGLTM